MQNVVTGLLEASVLPEQVRVGEIAEDALQACFALIGARLKVVGYPVTGDFSPYEVERLEAFFEGLVCAMALNNPEISAMQDSDV